ncbi:MAG: choice-of-anchor J domain-containing protein, partial [Muribaculaceae bacterium]|nr:choice-of-anchor J domain-containing protein [Muribaculaceae bacterium]
PKGNGTIDDPYNIAKAIEVAKANGQESSVMVYTEGYVASGSIDVSYGNATWDLTDNADGSGSKFIAYRVKSFDNQKFTDANAVKVGDKVVIYAPLINYMGNTPETGNGGYLYSLNGVAGGSNPPQGGDEPAQPGTALYTEAFSNTQGAFIIDNVTIPSDLTYVWQATETYGMKASAYANGKSYASESWLISPVFDLAKATGVALTFDTANNKYAKTEDIKTQATLWVSVDGGAWQQLAIPTYGSNADWNFVNCGTIDLSAYAGKKISLGFCYKSSDSASGTWEIKNFKLTGSGSVTTSAAVVPGK